MDTHFFEEGKLYGGHLLVQIWENVPGSYERKNGIIAPRRKLVHRQEYHNVIVANGKQLNAQRLFAAGGPPTQINTMAVGTDNTAATSAQTQLNPSVAGSTYFQAFDSTPSVTAGVATCIMTIGTGSGNFAHAEIGMFNGTVNGTSVMLDRIAPIGPFTKSSANTIAYTITYTQG